MITKLFNWLQSDEKIFHLSNQILSRDLLEMEQIQANQKNRMLLSNVRLAKLQGHDPGDDLSKLEQHILFMDYLQFCRKRFDEAPQDSLYLITLKYLLAKSNEETPFANAKLNMLFEALLQDDKDNTLAFYQQNEALFKDFPEVQSRVESALHQQKFNDATRRVENYLKHLSNKLSNQKNPLGIIGLCRDWVGDTEQFAALILWLLKRNVSPEQILQTYLLHDFLKYNLFTLHSEDSEVVYLYALLNHFPEAKLLVEEAQKTGSDERGFQNYTLDGVFREQELQNIPRKEWPLQFSLTATNFSALHELFGQRFLIAAVITCEEHNNATWLEALGHTLNEARMLSKELPSLINIIARESSPAILENLAHLIDDQNAQELLSNNEGAVFYLLPYKPKLSEYINEKNVTEFIHQITQKHTSDPEPLFQLMALFSLLSKKKGPVTQLVFQAIIDNLVQHPLLLEDEKLLLQLRRYPDCDVILSQQSEQIKQRVTDCIVEQVADRAFSASNYQIIEDIWLEATRKLNVFKLIKPQPKYNLNHKYALQAKIAETAFFHHGNQFDLDAFIEALSLPPVTPEDGVSEYERVLIEILAAIDNELIRKEIIEKLESAPVQRLNWVEKEYEGKTILLKAAKYGNLGLITLLEQQIVPDDFNKAIITAAKENQWNVVSHLCQIDEVQLNKDELEQIMLLAAGQGQLNVIKSLLSIYDYKPSSTEISKILNQAINNGNLNIVKYFYNSADKMPNQSIINKLFHSAIELGFWDIALFIADSEQYAPSLAAIEKAFNHAANNMHMEAIQRLCNLSTNAPRPTVILKAFLKACQAGHLSLVRCLHDLLGTLVRAGFEEAVDQAIINGHMEVVTFLYNSPTYSSNQNLVNHGLITAAKKGKSALVEFFCSMTAQNKPTQNAVNQALNWTVKCNQPETLMTLCRSSLNRPSKAAIKDAFLLAAKGGKQDIVTYLCSHQMNSLNQRAIEEALKSAVKSKQPEIVRYLCELAINSPQKESLKIAYRKALTSGQTEIADYLNEQLHKKISQKKIDPEIDLSSGTDNDSEIEAISESDSLCESDVEMFRNPTFEHDPVIDNSSEGEPIVDIEVGVSLKKHGFFKTNTLQDPTSVSVDLTKGSILR
ncbi:ankyrin repeat domain-containing protein [Fluoribacter gormanii]|uniref:ankyrin repeat domain-containing protein n=1 Tax=Fluoribacter gormanii TaxID=464 RepID=UPI0022431854|nr:ankyrin repeat domain-containing protein [Fluoribacter gormanii]MCW8470810.1 ankyrin repeat domain-containing protein [Fluoribacter gormanii]